MNNQLLKIQKPWLQWIVALSLGLAANPLAAETRMAASLNVSPSQCVAMTQGQVCYVNVHLSWQTNTKGDYCLYSSITPQPVTCWTQQQSGAYKQEFASRKNIRFNLRQKNTADVLATAEIEMAWVHKKRGQPQNWWRLF